MSDYEHQRGKIIKVVSETGVTLNQHCLNILKENNLEYDDWHKNPGRQIADDLYKEYVIINDVLYKYLELIDEDPYDSFVHLEEQDDGIINFSARYYNGGCGLSEMLEEGMENLKRDKDETERNS